MDLNRVLTNIKAIDCPVDALQDRIRDACKVPGIDGAAVVVVDRNEPLDRGELKAYDIHIMNENAPKITAMVREGQDGYVSTVTDAFTLY